MDPTRPIWVFDFNRLKSIFWNTESLLEKPWVGSKVESLDVFSNYWNPGTTETPKPWLPRGHVDSISPWPLDLRTHRRWSSTGTAGEHQRRRARKSRRAGIHRHLEGGGASLAVPQPPRHRGLRSWDCETGEPHCYCQKLIKSAYVRNPSFSRSKSKSAESPSRHKSRHP